MDSCGLRIQDAHHALYRHLTENIGVIAKRTQTDSGSSKELW